MNGTLDTIGKYWDRFWFEPDTRRSLALIRIMVSLHALWILLSRDHTGISAVTEFWTQVPQTSQWRYLLFPGHAALEGVLRWIAIGALLGACIGVFPRICCMIAGLLIYHLAPLEMIHSGSTPYAMGLSIAPASLLILAVSKSSDALCLWPRCSNPKPGPSGDYGWPRRLIWLLVAEIYLFAAYAKLVRAGLFWGTGDNIRSLFLRYGFFEKENLALTQFSLWLAEQAWLLPLIGVGTLILEWTFIAVLFSKVARRILIPLAFLFATSIAVTMGIHVGETWLLVLFVNFDWMLQKIFGPPEGPEAVGQGYTAPQTDLIQPTAGRFP